MHTTATVGCFRISGVLVMFSVKKKALLRNNFNTAAGIGIIERIAWKERNLMLSNDIPLQDKSTYWKVIQIVDNKIIL